MLRCIFRPNLERPLLRATAPLSFTRIVAPASSTRTFRAMSDIKQISTPEAAQRTFYKSPVATLAAIDGSLLARPHPLTRIIAVAAYAIHAGNQIFVSGQVPMDAAGNLITGSIGDQTAACCESLRKILEAAGSSMSRVVKVTVFLTSMESYAEMNGVYERCFGATRPARSCIAVKELPKGVPVEMECIALSGTG